MLEILRQEEEKMLQAYLETELKIFKKTYACQKNGCYQRQIKTSLGICNLYIPRTRKNEFHTTLFSKYSRYTKDFERQLFLLTKGKEYKNISNSFLLSKSTIKRFREKYLKTYEEFKARELKNSYEVVYLDSTFYYGNCISLLLGQNGKSKQVIDFCISKTEKLENYQKLLSILLERKIQVKMYVCDGFKGLANLLNSLFAKPLFQFCTNHFFRFQRKIKKTDDEFLDKLKALIKGGEDYNTCYQKALSLKSEYQVKIPKNTLARIFTFKKANLPYKTNNIIESFNHLLKSFLPRCYSSKNLEREIATICIKINDREQTKTKNTYKGKKREQTKKW